jgi:hypothetical protein
LRRLFFATMVATMALAAPAFADEDSVDTADGSIAVMSSGNVYQSTDGSDLGSWEGDEVTITDNGTMVNHDTGDEADVEQIN